MDWWFHILFALLLSPGTLSLEWFILGSFVLDVFFVLSFLSVAGFKPRSLGSMLSFGDKAVKTPFHKIGFALHSIFAFFIYLALCFIPNIAVKSLFCGITLHLLIDFASHKGHPNPIFYPFSMKRPQMGIIDWDLRNSRIIIPTLQLLSVLYLLKYFVFGFIF